MLTAGLRMVNEVFLTSTISNCWDWLSADLTVAAFGTLSSPTMMTRSSHVFVANFAVSSMNL
jgi:hypothetical protein